MLHKLHTRLFLMLLACFVFCFFIINNKSYAQYLGSYHLANIPMKISFGVGGGALSYDGDIGALDHSRLTQATLKPGFKIIVEQRFGNKTRFLDLFGFQLNLIDGSLAESDLVERKRNYSFTSTIFEGDLDLVLHLERLLNFNRRSRFSPYLLGGIGYLNFNSNVHTYITGQVNGSTYTTPFGAGLEYNFSYYFKVKFDYVMCPTGSDKIDGYYKPTPANHHNDWLKSRMLTILYTFGKPTMKYSHKRVRSRF